jgi:hypothetical protein
MGRTDTGRNHSSRQVQHAVNKACQLHQYDIGLIRLHGVALAQYMPRCSQAGEALSPPPPKHMCVCAHRAVTPSCAVCALSDPYRRSDGGALCSNGFLPCLRLMRPLYTTLSQPQPPPPPPTHTTTTPVHHIKPQQTQQNTRQICAINHQHLPLSSYTNRHIPPPPANTLLLPWTHSLLRCVGAPRRSDGSALCSNKFSPRLRLMRPVRHTSITPNLLSTRCMATVCRCTQHDTARGADGDDCPDSY